jgi:hypothetical protein
MVGGSIESVSIDGVSYPVTSDSDVSRKLGGAENETQVNGDGTVRTIQTRVPWMLSGVGLALDDTLGDHERIQTLIDSGRQAPVVITYASGESYEATGTVTGEVQQSNQTISATVTLSGGGKLTKQ